MFRIKPAARLAITIGLLCLSLVFLALGLNLVPDPYQKQQESRLRLVRTFATSVSSLIESNRSDLHRLFDRTLAIEPSIRSIGLRRDKRQVISSQGHIQNWTLNPDPNQVSVEIFNNSKNWGTLEVAFHPIHSGSLLARLTAFPFPLVMFLFAAVTLTTWYVLSRTFRYLNPSNVVPNRVRDALDSIGSGLAMITPQGEIAHANKAFGKIVQLEQEQIVGKHIDQFHWALDIDFQREFPWNRSRKFHETISGEIVQAKFNSGVVQKYMVSASPVFANANQYRGVLISFEDVTALEAKKSELSKVIQSMRMSRDEVQRQNEQLNFLANYDPLTRCMNRRSFYTEYERYWSETSEHPLAIMILDIDFFKAVNDNYGHSTGDEVLKTIGALLNSEVGSQGIVCRYGGEEFVVLLPNIQFEKVVALAASIRRAVEENPISGLKVTVSIGVSNRAQKAMDGQHMLDQADQCLYAAKRNGRNRVVSYDRLQEFKQPEPAEGKQGGSETVATDSNPSSPIEYSSVTGLLSALSFRSRATAEHSIRVADLAVDIGRSLLSSRELYSLEIAGLMHDVGKIGVPDSILNKPAKLTAEEWQIMKRHNEIGIAIVRSAFSENSVAKIIEDYYRIKNSNPPKSGGDSATNLLCAQILYVCDAFDSMLAGAVYRRGMSVDQAIAEILANTPNQFDEIVVKELVSFVESGRLSNRRYVASETKAKGLSANSECSANPLAKTLNLNPKHDELGRMIEIADDVMGLCQQANILLCESGLEESSEKPTATAR